MLSKRTAKFRECLSLLPEEVKREAVEAYYKWKNDPSHASLEFKEIRVNKNKTIWSARVSIGYRAIGFKPNRDLIVWVWIGSHPEYDKRLQSKRARNIGN